MTEETEVVMVECSLTGEQVKETEAIEYATASEEERYVSVNAALTLVQNRLLPTILNRVALNDDTYREVVAIRREALAKQSGVTDGANKAVEAIKTAAAELGVDVNEVIQKAFTPPETTNESAVS
ncbi:MAG: hypothetical protein HKO92_07045 [Flavobacteriaceae bacterium]|nr:hypothetical protein [Flavobacteriaceae bacterium]